MENYTAIREQLPAERGPTLPNALLSTCRSQLRRSQIEVSPPDTSQNVGVHQSHLDARQPL